MKTTVDPLQLWEPIDIFGFSMLECFVAAFLISAFIIIIFCVRLYKTPPFRVVLTSGASSTEYIWLLQRKEEWLFGEWKDVFESSDKGIIQTKARQALFAHYRFRDFVNQLDNEIISDAKVIESR